MTALDVTSVSFAALMALAVFHVAFAVLGGREEERRNEDVPQLAARRFAPRRARRI